MVGAGAAGLWAARVAAECGARVRLLEKTPRTGTKVLASGGTHCNLTTTLDAAAAGALFGKRGARFLRHGLRLLGPRAVRDTFAAWGVPTVEAPLEKVFPASGRARDVRDALERAARRAGVELTCSAPVRAVERGPRAWSVALDDGTRVEADRVVLAAGGKSYARTGTTGDGYGWLAELDLPLVEPVPALVPLTSAEPWVRALAGVDLQEASVRLVDPDGRSLAERRRPVLFTHRGLSGPAAMDVSVHVARRIAAGAAPGVVQIDLFPDVPHEALRELLVRAAAAPGAPRLREALPGRVPKRLFRALAARAELRTDEPRGTDLGRAERHRLVQHLKALPVPLDGTEGFDRAEVTAGGLELDALDAGTMEVKGLPGLFVCGELLDLDGPIGGLNFQAAFATAECAGRAAARP